MFDISDQQRIKCKVQKDQQRDNEAIPSGTQ